MQTNLYEGFLYVDVNHFWTFSIFWSKPIEVNKEWVKQYLYYQRIL